MPAPAAQIPGRPTGAVAWSAGGITRQRRASDRRTGPTTSPGDVEPGEPAPDDERRLQRRDAVVHRLALERVARSKRT
ncbi:MAG: hypothetical protein ACOH2F_00645 [Cellulomonas sp.]